MSTIGRELATLPPLEALPEQFLARVVSVPLDPQIVTQHYTITTIEMVLLRVRDEDGAEGQSTLWCFGLPQAQVLVQVLTYLAPFAVRARSRDLATIAEELRREINFFGFKGVSVFALSAIDMALTDLTCRRAGRSLGSVLGPRCDAVPAYWSGLFGNQTLEEILAEVDEKLDEGFRAMKLRVGRPTLDEDMARIEAVLAHAPQDMVLMLDAVQSWTRGQALDAVERMQGLPIHWLEDPLVHNDYQGLRAVVERSGIPIAAGENEYLSEGFAHLLDAGPQYLLADLERVGGIREWQIVAEQARQRGAVLTPHVYPHIALQLCSALDQQERWIEYIPWWNAISGEPLRLHDGALAVPDTPGAGLDLDADRVEALAVTAWTPLTA